MELQRAKLVAEAASVELATATRNQQIRSAIAAGLSLREIESATGIPRSTVQRIGAAGALTEAEYLRLANAEVMARAEVVALQSVDSALSRIDTARE